MISSELFQFIKSNQDADPTRLRLKYHGSDIPWMPLALNHLEALRKCGRKFALCSPSSSPLRLAWSKPPPLPSPCSTGR